MNKFMTTVLAVLVCVAVAGCTVEPAGYGYGGYYGRGYGYDPVYPGIDLGISGFHGGGDHWGHGGGGHWGGGFHNSGGHVGGFHGGGHGHR